MGQSKVAVAEVSLGRGDGIVDVDVIGARSFAHEAHDLGQCFAWLSVAQNLVGGNNRACIDERIAGAALFLLQLHDGVERPSGRFAPHAVP